MVSPLTHWYLEMYCLNLGYLSPTQDLPIVDVQVNPTVVSECTALVPRSCSCGLPWRLLPERRKEGPLHSWAGRPAGLWAGRWGDPGPLGLCFLGADGPASTKSRVWECPTRAVESFPCPQHLQFSALGEERSASVFQWPCPLSPVLSGCVLCHLSYVSVCRLGVTSMGSIFRSASQP